MTRRLIVTRAEPAAARTGERIRARGGVALMAPMLVIEPVAAAPLRDGAQAVIFTSAAGVRAFAAQDGARAYPALCVGEATAQAARLAGFADVTAAEGDGAALAALIVATRAPTAGPLLHLSGAHLAFDLAAALAPHGFTVERRIVYRARAAETLPQEIVTALTAQPLGADGVLFHSARGAAIFRTLVERAAPAAFASLEAVCLSAAIAISAGESPWRAMRTPASPSENALLDAAFAA